jgi:hypothetical protein
MLTFDFSFGSGDESRAVGCGAGPSERLDALGVASDCAVALGDVSGLRSSGAAALAFAASSFAPSGGAGGTLSTSVGGGLVFGSSESWFSIGLGGGNGTAAAPAPCGLADFGLGFVAGASGEPTGLIAAGMRTPAGPP